MKRTAPMAMRRTAALMLALGPLAGCAATTASPSRPAAGSTPVSSADPRELPRAARVTTPISTPISAPASTPVSALSATAAPTAHRSRPAAPATPTQHAVGVAPARTVQAAPQQPRPAYPATLSQVPASVDQALTVTAAGYGTTTATFEAWSRSGSGWALAAGPWTANLGYNGLAPQGDKREGDGRTPSGVFGFSFAFGVDANPGVHLSWRPVTGTYDVWDDDSNSARYNEWTDTRTAAAGTAPEPMDNTPAYDEGAVIAYNAARTPGLGSAIFLHVSTGGSTAGCVSLPHADLTQVLRWLQPGAEVSIGVR